MKQIKLATIFLLLGISQSASAHTGQLLVADGFSGFAHPFLGLDHTLAMLAVGVWAVLESPKGYFQLPIMFMAFMLLGGALGLSGIEIPGLEPAIAATVVLLGTLIAFKTRFSHALSLALVGLFAGFHGYAHGFEMAQESGFLAYSLGFVAATAILHLIGLGFGLKLLPKTVAYRVTGGLIGGIGLVLLMQAW